MDYFIEIIADFVADNVVIIRIVLHSQDFQAKVILAYLSINIATAAVSNQIERSSTHVNTKQEETEIVSKSDIEKEEK